MIFSLKNSQALDTKSMKQAVQFISHSLAEIFNILLDQGIFLGYGKISLVTSIHTDVNNYRSISVILLSKMLEKLMKIRLQDLLNSEDILRENQFRIRCNKSQTHVIYRTLHDIL